MTVHPLITSTQRAARPLSLICGVAFMADARAVTRPTMFGGEYQSFIDDVAVDEFTGEVDATYAEVTIRGRQYVLVLTPAVVEG